ncbi:hypothetical protein THAOC_35565, partial [Thalassiosira oceanica]
GGADRGWSLRTDHVSTRRHIIVSSIRHAKSSSQPRAWSDLGVSFERLRRTSSSYSRDDLNGDTASSASGITSSAAATTQWKRQQYEKIERRFRPDETKPLQIDNYEDVQPAWREMESRVTKRRSLTLEERQGVSGRRNVRKSDEDLWLQAGVYNSSKEEASNSDSNDDQEEGEGDENR